MPPKVPIDVDSAGGTVLFSNDVEGYPSPGTPEWDQNQKDMRLRNARAQADAVRAQQPGPQVPNAVDAKDPTGTYKEYEHNQWNNPRGVPDTSDKYNGPESMPPDKRKFFKSMPTDSHWNMKLQYGGEMPDQNDVFNTGAAVFGSPIAPSESPPPPAPHGKQPLYGGPPSLPPPVPDTVDLDKYAAMDATLKNPVSPETQARVGATAGELAGAKADLGAIGGSSNWMNPHGNAGPWDAAADAQAQKNSRITQYKQLVGLPPGTILGPEEEAKALAHMDAHEAAQRSQQEEAQKFMADPVGYRQQINGQMDAWAKDHGYGNLYPGAERANAALVHGSDFPPPSPGAAPTHHQASHGSIPGGSDPSIHIPAPKAPTPPAPEAPTPPAPKEQPSAGKGFLDSMKARQSVGGKTTEAPASPKASAWDEVKNPMVPQGLLEQFPGQTLAGGDFVSSSQRPSANLKSDFVSSSQRPSAKEPAPHLFSQMTAEEKAPRSAPLEHALDNLGKNIPPPDREGKPLPKPKQKAKFGL